MPAGMTDLLAPLCKLLGISEGCSRQQLRADLTAGLTTAVMLVPQGMAYAMLAGLPPIVGLYASLLPLIVYAFLGTSRQLAVGPVAMDSLLVASGVGAIAEGGSEAYIAYAALLAILAGGIQLALGLMRAGFVVKLLTRPVISGFTSAAALIIGFSQLGPLLGVKLERSQQLQVILVDALGHLQAIDGLTLAIGLGAIAALLALKLAAPDAPRALIVVVVGSLAVLAFDWLGLEHAVATVGEVPAGLPGFAWPRPEGMGGALETLLELAPTALAIALIGFMEAYSVADNVARQQDYGIDANRELVALGAANVATGLFSGYPVTGGFSRTAVNAQAGAQTRLAGLITAAVVGATLLVLTPLFGPLPKAVLAAIIMVAVFGLIDLREPARLWKGGRAGRWQLAVLAVSFLVTLTQGIQLGIVVGVLAAQVVDRLRLGGAPEAE